MRMFGIDVGEHRRLDPVAAREVAAAGPLAAGHQLGAVGDARLHHGADALVVALGVDRPHLRLVVERIAEPERRRRARPRARAPACRATSCSRSRLVEPQLCPCQAKFMPATAIAATLSGSMSGKAISGFLPPSSSVTCLMPPSAAARWMARPVGTEPVKAMRLTFGWRAMRVAGRHAEPGDDVDDARRQHLAADLAQHGGRQRARLRRLEHDAVAGHQRRRQRVGGELDRMVERDDAPDHAIGLADGEVQVLAARRDGLAFDLGGEARIDSRACRRRRRRRRASW